MSHLDDLAAMDAAKLELHLAAAERERLCIAHTQHVGAIQALNVVIAAIRLDWKAKRLVAQASAPPPPP